MLFSILKIQELEFLLQTLKIITVHVFFSLFPTEVKRKICIDYSVATSTVSLNLSLQELPRTVSLKTYYFHPFKLELKPIKVIRWTILAKIGDTGSAIYAQTLILPGERNHIISTIRLYFWHPILSSIIRKISKGEKRGWPYYFDTGSNQFWTFTLSQRKLTIPQLTFYWFYGKVLLLKCKLLNEMMRNIT